MSQSQRRFVRQLRLAGVEGVRKSEIPSGCSDLLRELQTCGATSERPSGRGSVFFVSNANAFELFVQDRYPLGLDRDLGDVEDRASGVQLFADAKAARRGRFEGVFARSTVLGATLNSDDGTIPVGQLTPLAGGAAVCFGDDRKWSFRGVVAVIENAEAFWQHERVLPDVDLAVFASGRLSERVLSWLASNEMSDCHFVHWGDYDPFGCVEYLRLRERCPGRTRMYFPASVAELLPRHGKRRLILEQVRELDALRTMAFDAAVTELIAMFDTHRRGLEQEALLMHGTGGASSPHGGVIQSQSVPSRRPGPL
ncbi:hypothetical protein PHYC_02047 [Phycisphaerales bacterium]|nr:hypothetical protein PHYC_02047 [Phycisphaerales bacterium]